MVIQTGVETEHVDRIAAFLLPAGHADNPAPLDFTDLPHRCADRPRGCRHDKRFPRLRLADIKQPHIRGEARHSQHAECP
ncbi:Uncharacterised protein [Enterobacter cloacae]|nr:Uncharacterised protein [Enterobacter cloacae]